MKIIILFIIFSFIETTSMELQEKRGSKDVEQLWNFVREKIFEGNNTLLTERLEGNIKERLRNSPPSTPINIMIPRTHTDHEINDIEQHHKTVQFLTRLVNEAVEDHLKERDIDFNNKKCEVELEQKRAEINYKRFKIATVANVLTAIVVAAITASVALTQNCSNS